MRVPRVESGVEEDATDAGIRAPDQMWLESLEIAGGSHLTIERDGGPG
jgi:hypothetical protein